MVKSATFAFVLLLATGAYAQVPANKNGSAKSLTDEERFLAVSCDMNKTLLSLPENAPGDTKKYEFAQTLCMKALRFSKELQDATAKLEAVTSELASLKEESKEPTRTALPKAALVLAQSSSQSVELSKEQQIVSKQGDCNILAKIADIYKAASQQAAPSSGLADSEEKLAVCLAELEALKQASRSTQVVEPEKPNVMPVPQTEVADALQEEPLPVHINFLPRPRPKNLGKPKPVRPMVVLVPGTVPP
jgi:chemotaxis protein histidine kinase CheA